MTDDEITRLLRPRHDWLKIAVAVAALLGAAWGVARWAATTPSREEFNALSNRITSVQLDQTIMNGHVSGTEQAVQRIEHKVDRLDEKLEAQQNHRR